LKKHICQGEAKNAVWRNISQLYVFYVGRILKGNKRTWNDVTVWEEKGTVAKQGAKETRSEEKRQAFCSQQRTS
jgi:hypothetical protein